MDSLWPRIKWIWGALLAGVLISAGPELGKDVLPLAGLMVAISLGLVLWELATLEPSATLAVGRDLGDAAAAR